MLTMDLIDDPRKYLLKGIEARIEPSSYDATLGIRHPAVAIAAHDGASG